MNQIVPSLTEREKMRERPCGPPVMTQRWAKLSFLHVSVEPETVQALLPPGLEVDTYPDEEGRERAWVGLVPFQIQDLSFRRGLRVPTASTFLETNVRTYVHRNGENPGVWFFSLEAASALACKAARVWFGLPYWYAQMSFREDNSRLSYSCERLAPPRPTSRLEVTIGGALSVPQPGSFEFFLVERYLLYSYFRARLYIGRVHHEPYRLHEATVLELQDELQTAAGLPSRPPTSVLYSEGVDVEIFRPTRIR